MGMFDWVRCTYPLPVPEHRAVQSWQTKSFEQPNMRHITVTGEGRLLIDGSEVTPPFTGVLKLLEFNEDETERWLYWLTFESGRVVNVRGETQPGLGSNYVELELGPGDDD